MRSLARMRRKVLMLLFIVTMTALLTTCSLFGRLEQNRADALTPEAMAMNLGILLSPGPCDPDQQAFVWR